jgi:hypothetical protein
VFGTCDPSVNLAHQMHVALEPNTASHYKFSGFRSGAVLIYVVPGQCAAALGNWCLTFWDVSKRLTSLTRDLPEKLTGHHLVKKFPLFYGNPKVHYLIHKNLPPCPNLSQIDPVHAPQPTSRTYILILSSHLRLSLPRGLLTYRFPHKNPLCTSNLPHTRDDIHKKKTFRDNDLSVCF